jgi:hypothetical protein
VARVRKSELAFLALIFLILGAAAFVGVTALRNNPPAPTQALEPSPEPTPIAAQPHPQPAPQPEPEASPESEPSVKPEPAHVRLPRLSRFRALVTEADAALALLDAAPGSEAAWEIYSTLEQLGSRFAPHARLVYDSTARNRDHEGFRSEVRSAFLAPDIHSDAFRLLESERIALWLHAGAELPSAENEPPLGELIPLGRRLQEWIDQDALLRWLAAIEGEFGQTSYGAGTTPLDIVVCADSATYQALTRRRLRLNVPAWSAGMYSSGWDLVCLPVMANASLAEVIRHEMFHAVQARLAPESLLAPWFAEGTAEWLDKAPPRGGRLRTHTEFAAGAWGYLALMVERGYELRLREFLELELPEFYADPELNYLVAYCWIDFVRAESDLRPLYMQYWELLKQGVNRHNALARTFGGLDLEAIEERMLHRARLAPRNTTPPRFTIDTHEQALGRLPPSLHGAPLPPGQPGSIASGWFRVMTELQRRGFDVSRSAPFTQRYELLVIAVDSSETMLQPPAAEFDFDALSRWMFAARYAARITLERENLGAEEVPAGLKLALIDAALTDRVEEFSEVTGISLGQAILHDIRQGYDSFGLTPSLLRRLPKRDIAMHAAESLAWNLSSEEIEVVVIDFNTRVRVEREARRWSISGFDTRQSPVTRLFNRTYANRAPLGADGSDCDWWLGLSAILEHAHSRPAACLFFTDGPNTAGAYGHARSTREPESYRRQQQNMADDFALRWPETGSSLLLVALPGAEGEGLELLPHKANHVALDEWAERFKR